MLEAIICLLLGLIAGYFLASYRSSSFFPSSPLRSDNSKSIVALVVRADLKMGKGKTAAQCCHASLGLWTESRHTALAQTWAANDYPHVVFKVTSEEQLLSLAQKAEAAHISWYLVTDAGRTQIEPGSKTVLGLGPCPRGMLDTLTDGLQPS